MTIKNAFYEREVEWHDREAQWKTIIEDLTELNAKLVAALEEIYEPFSTISEMREIARKALAKQQ